MKGARTRSSDTARGGTGARGETRAHKRTHHGLSTCARCNTQTVEGGTPLGLLRAKAGREG
eukprot:3932046-Pleurochrysis_carterae.AAC.1